MATCRTKTHLQVVKIFSTLSYFLWINYSLCGAYMQGRLVRTNVEVCLSYCTRSNTQHPSVQFCECIIVLQTDITASLLRTWRNTDVVGIVKRPVNNTIICQVMCRDLLECKDWLYDTRRRLCFLGNRDPEQTTPTATGMSYHTSKSSPNMRTSKRNSDRNGVATPTTEKPSHLGEAPIVKTCDNCKAEEHQCNNGLCECAMGYSVIKGSSHCVKECPLYSNEFSVQSERLCKTAYHARYQHVTEDQCRQKCVSAEPDKCVAYEFYRDVCFLFTKHTLDSNVQWDDLTQCVHHQRMCKTCDKTCVAPNYACDRGLCHCNVGYSLTTDGKCVKGCNAFAKTFAKHATARCQRVYPGSHYRISSLEKCRDKCLSENFKCAAFAFTGELCFTAMWDEVSFDSKDWYYAPSCSHYTRRCDHEAGACLTTCRQPNYICKNRKCVCNIGFSATTDGKCVKGCSSYEDSFTVQQEGLCMWKYQRKYVARNTAWCKKKCIMSDIECASFEMYKDTCHINKWKLKYYQPEIWQPYTGCKHYTRNCNHKGSHCDVCDGPQYRCRDNKCVCSRGYSFVVGVATCVGECVSYAHSFTKQSTHHCLRIYKRKYPETTAKTCEHKCRHEKKFTCGAFHIYEGNCYTMEWDMTSLEKTWERKEKGCEQYIRDCKPNCEMGYSLIPDKNRCVRDCKVYSTKFQKQSNFICDTKFDKKLKHVDRRGCERACLKSKKTCDGYELYKNDCYVIAENKGHRAEWKVYDKGCTHHQRICKE